MGKDKHRPALHPFFCALAMVAIAHGSQLAYHMDNVGSAAVSLYLLINVAIILFA